MSMRIRTGGTGHSRGNGPKLRLSIREAVSGPRVPGIQVSSSFGTLPPLSAIFLITTLWSQMFIAAESPVSPV